MYDAMKSASASNAPAEMSVSPAAVESRIGSGEHEMQFLSESILPLPSYAVKGLLFRRLGIEQQVYCSSSFSPSLLCSFLEESTSPEAEVESEFCSVCLGILQFKWRDDKETLVKKESANDMTELIAEIVKQEGHQIDSFSLEVSVPQGILDNESAILSDMKRKYGSELWFREKPLSEPISVKDALKFAIVKPLESLLHTELSTYIRYCMLHTNAAAVRPSNGLQARDASECLGFSIEKVNEPCHLELQCYRTPIYLGSRYLKVRVKNLKVVGSEGWTMMREGESEKQKQYAALVWISHPLDDKDLKTISLLKDVAGTYIKEFVHGDLGRTHPSVGSILGCRAEILQLDVTDVKMDCFLIG
ncbi:hypothetical protein SLE2022_173190 [Rubroshorea leprosula]